MSTHGGARPRAGRKPLFDHKRAAELKQQGLTYAELSARFGRSPATIASAIARLRRKSCAS